MTSQIGRVALGWAMFLVLASVVLLFTLTPGTPEFVVTLCLGLLLGLIVVAAVVLTRRREKREDG
jgi:hypothetical protein